MLSFFAKRQIRRQLAELRPCPLPRELDLSLARRVLVFAPHPDDETIGCGGTLSLLAKTCLVKVVLVTDGSGAGGLPAGAGALRQEEFIRALALLGVTEYVQLNQHDGFFEDNAQLGAVLEQIFDDFQPNWVFLPSPLDYHRDHVRIAAFVEPFCRRAKCVSQILFYEVWAPVPATHVVDITDQFDLKRAALSEHVTALACGDYQRAVEGLNRYRGLYIGRNKLAEAFWVESTQKPDLFRKVQALALELLSFVGRA